MYTINSFNVILLLINIATETAGFIWHPDIFPIAYAIATTDRPNANAVATKLAPPNKAPTPHAMKTNTNVPKHSAIPFLVNSYLLSPFLCILLTFYNYIHSFSRYFILILYFIIILLLSYLLVI